MNVAPDPFPSPDPILKGILLMLKLGLRSHTAGWTSNTGGGSDSLTLWSAYALDSADSVSGSAPSLSLALNHSNINKNDHIVMYYIQP